MRDDMKKVLTERPRHRASFGYHQFRRRDARGDHDMLPHCEGMRRPYKKNWGDCKEFSDLLGPLKRFLRSCVGRRWDDVWSEICQNVDGSSVTGRHLRDHVLWEVETQTRLIHGEVRYISLGRDYGVGGLHVDPRDGILRNASRITRSLRQEDRVILDGASYKCQDKLLVPKSGSVTRKVFEHGKKEAACFNGVWNWVTFGDVPEAGRRIGTDGKATHWLPDRAYLDIVTGREVKAGRYRCGKRQMNNQDLRRLDLTNDVN